MSLIMSLNSSLIKAVIETELQNCSDIKINSLTQTNCCFRTDPHLIRVSPYSFSYDHSQMKPYMFWSSLINVLRCLLIGSPSLERLSFVSLPCILNAMLLDVLIAGIYGRHRVRAAASCSPAPLQRLRHLDLRRTDVAMLTVKRIMQRSRELRYVDLSYCWNISKQDCMDLKRSDRVEIIWE